MNRYIDERLRPFISYYQDNWSDLIPLMDRAQVTLPHSSIGMAPYHLLQGHAPRTSWDWRTPLATTPRERLNYAEARELATRAHRAWEIAKANLEKAQATMAKNKNQHRRAIDWEVGDYVWISTRNLFEDRSSRKLAFKRKGPYKVLKQVGHSYRLELPLGSDIHDVFAPELLEKASNNPLPGQEPPRPDGDIIAGEKEWEVEDILASKTIRKKLQYRVKWVGHNNNPE